MLALGACEGLDIVRWLNGRGYTAFLLKYRVSPTPAKIEDFFAQQAAIGARHAEKPTSAQSPKAMDDLINTIQRPSPLGYARDISAPADDGRRALALVREARRRVRRPIRAKIGMIEPSPAGAFLVADVPPWTRKCPRERAAFIAPIYGGAGPRGKPVPADAAPMFTVVAQDDRLLFHMVEGLYLAWSDADRSAELHIFARGAHGFGLIPQGMPSDRWIDLFDAWLADNGFA